MSVTDESDFRRALDAEPANAALRLVFADWLEEHGDWRAEGYRWLGTRRKVPHYQQYRNTGQWYYYWGDKDVGVWPGTCCLGQAVMDAIHTARLAGLLTLVVLSHVPVAAQRRIAVFPSRRKAEEAVCLAMRFLGGDRELAVPARAEPT